MSKVNFTPEQIFAAAELFKSYVTEYEHGKTRPGFSDYLDSLLRPKKKKVIFEFEFPEFESHRINKKDLTLLVCPPKDYISPTVKITELPEVFTREDVVGILTLNVTRGSHFQGWNSLINKWLSERSKK